jgi:hypothetical protein
MPDLKGTSGPGATVTRAPEDSTAGPRGRSICGRTSGGFANSVFAPSGYTVRRVSQWRLPSGPARRMPVTVPAWMRCCSLPPFAPRCFTAMLADLGAGAGGAGLAAASAGLPQLDAFSSNARRSWRIAPAVRFCLPKTPGSPRASRVLEADVTLQGSQRRAAGLADRAFDYVIMNPPFNAAADRHHPTHSRRRRTRWTA